MSCIAVEVSYSYSEQWPQEDMSIIGGNPSVQPALQPHACFRGTNCLKAVWDRFRRTKRGNVEGRLRNIPVRISLTGTYCSIDT